MSSDSTGLPIRVNPDRRRFEVEVDGHLAELSYFATGGQVVLVHAAVPEPLEGRGIAAALSKYALDWAREQGLRVVPRCPYVRSYVARHHDWDDIVDSPV